jgi:NAD(P)-dependent dehydrogenase (short-subunit alcohol dehydrogenase family)
MELQDKTILITGGARGIGAAMSRRFAAEGASAIAIADLDFGAASSLAAELTGPGINAIPVAVDVSNQAQVCDMIRHTEDELGPLDLMCSNAGIYMARDVESGDEDWERNWAINVMSNVYVAREIIPRMVQRGKGYILITCSAAGMLANADPAYMATKHAAIAFAEWLAIRYRSRGITVSALCPLGVRTQMLTKPIEIGSSAIAGVLAGGKVLEPEEVAAAVVRGLSTERFLILPHEEVRERIVKKAIDRDVWLTMMEHQFGTFEDPASNAYSRSFSSGRDGNLPA